MPGQQLPEQVPAIQCTATAELPETPNELDSSISDELLGIGLELRGESNNVGHFATLVTRVVFQPDELANKNCNGKKGKERLDVKKLAVVRKLTFSLFDVPLKDQEHVWSSKCVRAIDELLRRPHRNRNKQK